MKIALRQGNILVGSWITLGHPTIAEIMAKAGFSWLAVDLEHSVITIREAEELIRVIDLCGVVPLVRLTANDSDQIKRVLDAGARGLIVPFVNSAADSERAVASAYYHPRGRRGVGLARAQGYGTQFKGYLRWLDEEGPVVIAMIEHVDAVGRIKEILSVSGIDGYFIGPYDLSASMGIPGQFDRKEFVEALTEIRETAAFLKIPGGIHVVEPDPMDLRRRLDEGYQFVAYSLDTRILDSMCRKGLSVMKGIS